MIQHYTVVAQQSDCILYIRIHLYVEGIHEFEFIINMFVYHNVNSIW